MVNSTYENYKQHAVALIKQTLEDSECQPIFFIGTGISKRYLGAPTWIELLRSAAARIGLSDQEFQYFRQKTNDNLIEIGSILEDKVFEWAWTHGKNTFPPEYFSKSPDKSIFLKHIIALDIQDAAGEANTTADSSLREEIDLLSKTNPHAIITTNYDDFLERVFGDYEPVVGEKVIRRDMNLVGEIFKIHGSMEDPSSIVITGADYENYRIKKKYISAKLLTYLAEHPVFIFGYGLGDTNVTGILQDIGEILGGPDKLIENVFYIEWRPDAPSLTDFREEYVVSANGSELRVRAIVTDSFGWIFQCLTETAPLKWVNPKLLRAISARFFKLLRSDIPRGNIEVDYAQLQTVADSETELPKLLGIARTDSPNASYPYSLTDVSSLLGFTFWWKARKLIEQVRDETGVDIFSTDNKYHYAIPTKGKHPNRRYSKEIVDLLEAVRDGEEYTVSL
ncbi:SIR2 family protein [Kaistia nematophila]|uniref:SIR2 family protein n=1 Tax=Kaistia nematophila TaxID=2994654 RepID=A0A9X3IPU7_9HYPH|nr:SIR2 family protein [Kaistia nematophila]MCX5572315.1 SIR2 family protein [Kaistia nematophila]